MTTAAVPPLKKWGMTDYVNKLCTPDYDPRDVPVEEKTAITAGMSMTEKQGGSDVRANTTMATPESPTVTGNGAGYRLVGHKVSSCITHISIYIVCDSGLHRLLCVIFFSLFR